MRAGVVAATTGVILLGGGVASVHADQPERARHCVVHVSTDTIACYETFREAISQATGGFIKDAPMDARAAIASEGFTQEINSMVEADGSPRTGVKSVVASIQFSDKNGQGTTLTAKSERGCDDNADVDGEWRDVDNISPAWDDQISSFRGYSKCQVNMWEHPGFNGANNGWQSSDMDMGAMNNQASSIRWR